MLLGAGLTENESELLMSAFGQEVNFGLLFDSNIHRQTAEQCHNCIDGQGRTITIVKTGGVCFLICHLLLSFCVYLNYDSNELFLNFFVFLIFNLFVLVFVSYFYTFYPCIYSTLSAELQPLHGRALLETSLTAIQPFSLLLTAKLQPSKFSQGKKVKHCLVALISVRLLESTFVLLLFIVQLLAIT